MGAVFLDLDGTLTDPKPGITSSFAYALEQVGLKAPPTDQLEWVIGPPLLHSFRDFGAPDPDLALSHYRDAYEAGGITDCAVFAGIPEALGAMRDAGHRLFLMTAKPIDYAVRVTAHFGLDGYLQDQFGPPMDNSTLPKAELLRTALPKVGAEAARSVMIGDRKHDIAAGQANGVATIAVAWGYGDDAERALADAICAEPSGLPGLVAGLIG